MVLLLAAMVLLVTALAASCFFPLIFPHQQQNQQFFFRTAFWLLQQPGCYFQFLMPKLLAAASGCWRLLTAFFDEKTWSASPLGFYSNLLNIQFTFC
jgi:hypothetical protein